LWNCRLIYKNVKRILLGNEEEFPIQSLNNFNRTCFNEMNDEFWLQTGNYYISIKFILEWIYFYKLQWKKIRLEIENGEVSRSFKNSLGVLKIV
jgi:hypothetical protein